MTLLHVIILLLTGAGIGFASGLLGVGGGFIMTPIQFWLFQNMGLPVDVALKMAIGTSLMVVLPTAASGAWRHHREKAVRWKAAFIMGACGFTVAFGGSALATHLPTDVLKTIFGIVVIIAALSMLLYKASKTEKEPVNNPWVLLAWSVPIGMMVGLSGIGGGVIAVPVMVSALRFKMHDAVATSLAMVVFNSIGGVIGYIVNGIGVPNRPEFSIGYINLPSWFLLSITSIVVAQVGAMVAHRTSVKWLRWIFIALAFYVGLQMLGAFTWI